MICGTTRIAFGPRPLRCTIFSGRIGSIAVAESSDRHGRTCFNTGRQGTLGTGFPIGQRTSSAEKRGALADLDEIFAYIAAGSREAAGRLVARIERVATRIAASPHIGGTTRKSGFLRFPVGKYLIVYEIVSDEVVVLYVRHSARPGPWEGK
jgi:toxin ParE1/3/4